MRLKNLVLEYWPFLLPVLILLPRIAGFPFPGSGAAFSDLAITHYPNAIFLKNAILQGEIPLWNFSILSGYPFIAHPYSGIWYPPYWAALLFPLPFGLNLLTGLHLMVAGIGMYAVLRQSGLGRAAAIFGGLAFSAAPKLFAHIGAGHLMLVLAVCWTPWLLWSGNRGGKLKMVDRFLPPGVILAIIFLIDPRWAIYAGLLVAGWWVAHSQRENIGRRSIAFLKQIGLAGLLAFPAAWLFLEYSQLSTRAALTPAEVLELSLPPSLLLGLIVPQWGGFHEWVVYPGVLVLALAIIALFSKKFGSQTKFWSAVFLLVVLISLGQNISGNSFIAGLPVFDQLRIPPRAFFLAALALAALAAFGIQFLVEQKKAAPAPRLVFVFLIALTLIFSIVGAFSASSLSLPSLCAAGILVAAWLAYELRIAKRIGIRYFVLLAFSLLVVDLGFADASLIRFRSAASVLSEDHEVAEFLARQLGQFRVYSPSYSVAQPAAADTNLELANGVDPLQLEQYARFMESASGVPWASYSVSLPRFSGTQQISQANAGFTPDPELLGLLNTRYIVSDFRLEAHELMQVAMIGDSYIYENNVVRPRAWIENSDHQVRSLTDMDWGFNRITIGAIGPGRLVLSEVMYPGWFATVDGLNVPIEDYAGILRSVMLGAGEHEIIFEFAPSALRFGIFVPLATVIGLMLWPMSRKRG